MGQAITDYVKFLADARDAVYRLDCDQKTAGQLEVLEKEQERELEAAGRAGPAEKSKGKTREGQEPRDEGADSRRDQ